MKKSKKSPVARRDFLRFAATGAAALVTSAQAAQVQKGEPVASGAAPAPQEPERAEVLTTDRPGSNFLVDGVKSLGFEYVCCNPGSSFRSLQESLVNYGQNQNPELFHGRAMKFTPRNGANPNYLLGKPLYPTWKN